jgi:hypothetical protein
MPDRRYSVDLEFVLDYYAGPDGRPDPARPGEYPTTADEITAEARLAVVREYGVAPDADLVVEVLAVAGENGFPELRFVSSRRDVVDAIRFGYARASYGVVETDLDADADARRDAEAYYPIAVDGIVPPYPGPPAAGPQAN